MCHRYNATIIALFCEPPATMKQAQEGVRVSRQRPVMDKKNNNKNKKGALCGCEEDVEKEWLL